MTFRGSSKWVDRGDRDIIALSNSASHADMLCNPVVFLCDFISGHLQTRLSVSL